MTLKKRRDRYEVYPDDCDDRIGRSYKWERTNSPGKVVVALTHRWTGRLLKRLTIHGGDVSPEHERVRVEAIMGFIKRTKAALNGRPAVRTVRADAEFAAAYPALSEYLTLGEVEGVRRDLATLSISWTPSEGFKAFLNDKDTSSYLCCTADGFDDVLGALEARLKADDPGWRESKGYDPGKKKKA